MGSRTETAAVNAVALSALARHFGFHLGLIDMRFATGKALLVLAGAVWVSMVVGDFFFYWFHRGRRIPPRCRTAISSSATATARASYTTSIRRADTYLLWIFLLVCNLAYARASLPALTAAQWRQDLGYFGNEIAMKHRDPYHFIARAKFDQSISELRQRIPSLKDYEVVVGLQHLAALIGDGHTFLDTRAVFPDQRIDPSWRSFSAGKDAALQWILAQPFPDRRQGRPQPREDAMGGLACVRRDGDAVAGDRTLRMVPLPMKAFERS